MLLLPHYSLFISRKLDFRKSEVRVKKLDKKTNSQHFQKWRIKIKKGFSLTN